MTKISELLNDHEKCLTAMELMVIIAFAITLAAWGVCKSIILVLDTIHGDITPNIKAVEIDDIRQYKFTDTENNMEFIVTEKPNGCTVTRKNIK